MDLVEVLKTYLSDDQQGQLVIKFVGENHLCKISVENGKAIYLTFGTMGPTDALDAMVGKVAEWSNFIKGLPARKRLDEPINQLLLDIAGATPPAEGGSAQAVAISEDTALGNEIIIEGAEIDAARISAVTNQFIDLVGPFGTIIIEKIIGNLAYTDGASMNAATYTRFVAALSAEISDDDRQSFIDAAAQ
jgi:hypothetical protein